MNGTSDGRSPLPERYTVPAFRESNPLHARERSGSRMTAPTHQEVPTPGYLKDADGRQPDRGRDSGEALVDLFPVVRAVPAAGDRPTVPEDERDRVMPCYARTPRQRRDSRTSPNMNRRPLQPRPSEGGSEIFRAPFCSFHLSWRITSQSSINSVPPWEQKT